MKTALRLLVAISVSMILNKNSHAQCSMANHTAVLTHDTLLQGVGIDGPYNITFPKFDPEMGTLLGIRIHSVVTVNYGFTMENEHPAAKSSRTRFYRTDELTGATISGGITNDQPSPYYGFYALGGSDGIDGSGSDFIHIPTFVAINADTLINETRYNVAQYLGPGNVQFEYTTYTSDLTTSATRVTGTMTDRIRFGISYVYCAAASLSPDMIRINAENGGAQTGIVKWTTNNESQAKFYEVHVSDDGRNFALAGTVQAMGNFVNDKGSYTFKHNFSSPSKKLYYRVKQVTKADRVLLSAIKPVIWSNKVEAISFVPDQQGSFITVKLPPTGGDGWKVDLLGVNGQLIQQDRITNANTNVITMKQRLSTGVYVIRAMNTTTSEIIAKKIMVQ